MAKDSTLPRFSNIASLPAMAVEKESWAGSAVQHDIGAKEAIARDIVRGLYDGRYQPGQRLREVQLTKHYGVSRGPVREALNALAAMNIIELTPQCGAQVRILRIQEAIDILVVAQNLIGLSARLSAKNCKDAEARAKLEKALETIAAFSPDNDSAEFTIARDRFYGALLTMAANAELHRILPTVQIHLIRVQFRSELQINDRSRHQDYRRIAEAIFSAHPREAEAAARNHIERSIERLRTFQSEKVV